MRVYHKSNESGEGPAWICGHWNGSPLAIGTGVWSEVGLGEARHHHPYREYYVVLEGSAKLEVEGEIIPLRAGMVVMVEPGERHSVVDGAKQAHVGVSFRSVLNLAQSMYRKHPASDAGAQQRHAVDSFADEIMRFLQCLCTSVVLSHDCQRAAAER